MSHTSAASSAVLAATTSFRWVDLLEKEFDKVSYELIRIQSVWKA